MFQAEIKNYNFKYMVKIMTSSNTYSRSFEITIGDYKHILNLIKVRKFQVKTIIMGLKFRKVIQDCIGEEHKICLKSTFSE